MGLWDGDGDDGGDDDNDVDDDGDDDDDDDDDDMGLWDGQLKVCGERRVWIEPPVNAV